MATLRERCERELVGDLTIQVTYDSARMRAQYAVTDDVGTVTFTARNVVAMTIRDYMRRFPGWEKWDGFMDTPDNFALEFPKAEKEGDVMRQTIRIEAYKSEKAPYRMRLTNRGFWGLPQNVIDSMKNRFQ